MVAAGFILARLDAQPATIYFAGLRRSAVRRARHRVEHPRRLCRLRELRHPGLLRPGGVHRGLPHQACRRRCPCRSWPAGSWPALLGLGIGYLTLRLRGTFFSIATLALSVVLQTLFINWEYVGGARGSAVVRPRGPPFGNYVQFLFVVMLALAVVAVPPRG